MPQYPTKQYAQAFFEYSDEKGELPRVYKDVLLIEKLIRESEDLNRFLAEPIYTHEQQEAVIKKIFHKQVDAATLHFIIFLISKSRLDLLQDICQAFEKLYYEKKNIAQVLVETTQPLNHQQMKVLSSRLKHKLVKEIETQTMVKPELIGGLRIQVEDMVYDHSFRAQLDKFHQDLLKA